jgi:hypothetical protein
LLQGLPKGAVQNAMQRDGLDPTIMDLDPDKSVTSQLKKDDSGPPLKEDPKYQKYFKVMHLRYAPFVSIIMTLIPDIPFFSAAAAANSRC